MSVTLPVTCLQLAYLILVALFIIGQGLLITTGYTLEPFLAGFFGWLLTGMALVFGLIALAVYIDDHQLIRCKCNRK